MSINIQSPIAPWMLSVFMEFFLKQRVRPVTLQGKNRPVSFPSLTKNSDFCLAFSGPGVQIHGKTKKVKGKIED